MVFYLSKISFLLSTLERLNENIHEQAKFSVNIFELRYTEKSTDSESQTDGGLLYVNFGGGGFTPLW